LRAVSDWPLTKFIYTGSCSEYGFPAGENVLIAEDQPLRPASIYGAAKAATEFYGNALGSQLKIPFVTARLFNVFGPGEKPHRLLRSIIDHLQHDQSVDLTGGEQQRDLLHVEDVVDALLAAASSERVEPFAAYNICSGVPARIREAGEIAADVLGKPRSLLQWGKLPYRSDEPMWVVGDPTRFRHATSWHPKRNLAEGIRHMIAAVRGREHQHAV
jgi:nucleoside-diphosphate-sugar epimerase